METVIKKWQKNELLPEVDDFPGAQERNHEKKNKENKGKERIKSRQQIIITFTSRWSHFCRWRKEKENITGVKIEMEVQRNILKTAKYNLAAGFRWFNLFLMEPKNISHQGH